MDYNDYTEQDTLDTLILPYLVKSHGFPKPDSLDYQAQHTLPTTPDAVGRYDGLYLSEGYPYTVLEAKRYNHDLVAKDQAQAIGYATSDFFDKPVPIVILSNGREHQFFKKTDAIDPSTGKQSYVQIPATGWDKIRTETPGEVRQLLTEQQLLDTLRTFKQRTYDDIFGMFFDPAKNELDPDRHPLGSVLQNIVKQRRNFVGDTTSKSASKNAKLQQSLQQAIQGVALHFTIKILFIKLIEDLSSGAENPRVIHTLFPQQAYDQVGGLFGYKVLNALNGSDHNKALRLYLNAKNYYKNMAKNLARVTWQDIFRYGFNVQMGQYGQLFRAEDYDRFLPAEETLEDIRNKLIEIDIRTAVIYGSKTKRSNVVGDIYERLIDDELRAGLGAIYTPDITMLFMIDLGQSYLKSLRGKKIVEPACGSGHFYRELYRRYVDEVYASSDAAHLPRDPATAHEEALKHIYGRDIDPFAVQLTLLSTFLEQLKDNVGTGDHEKKWLADQSVDTQNSLDPITVDPDADFGLEVTGDVASRRSLRASAKRALDPDLVIGNPPYGVQVMKGARYDTLYDLQSKDSYGYFIVNALERLQPGKRLIFIVSSSFLTIGSHKKLRQAILKGSKIIRVIKLHRSTFPGIDIFPVIIELERCLEAKDRDSNQYQFYDLWRLHPERHKDDLAKAYKAILSDLSADKPFPFEASIANRYTVRQGILRKYHHTPIFEGLASCYEYMAEDVAKSVEVDLLGTGGTIKKVEAQTVRGKQVVKLEQIADIKIGLQSGNNPKFYRTAPGVRGGAAKGGYHDVALHQVVPATDLQAISAQEKEHGFEVNDKSNDAFFVPLDKAGASDIEGGLLPLFWRPHEFFVDWSSGAVTEMKAYHGKGGVFRNPQFYFRKGISYSTTGIYSPTFRLGHGGVFDQKSSCIFCDVLDDRVLLGILCSTAIRYFAKSFINHGVDAQVGELPIVLPTKEQADRITKIVDEIVAAQKADHGFDYRPLLEKLDDAVNDLYGLKPNERDELKTWYKRHYPNLFGQVA